MVVLNSLYDFLLVFDSKIWPKSAAIRDISLWYVSDIDKDLSRSLEVKCGSVIGLSIYGFLLMFNSNIWLNSAPLRDIRPQNLSDLEFDLSRTLKVKYDDVIRFSIYSFLFTYILTACVSLTV